MLNKSIVFGILTSCVLSVLALFFCGGGKVQAQSVPPVVEISALKNKLTKSISSKERAEAFARLGMLYLQRSADSCYQFAVQALEMAQVLDDKLVEARARAVLAYYYLERGNHYLSESFISNSIDLAREIDNQELLCEMTMHRGVLLGKEGKIDQALIRLEDAFLHSQELESDSMQALILLQLGNHQIGRVPYAQIEQFFMKAKDIAHRNKDEFTFLNVEIAQILAGNQLDPNPRALREALKGINQRCLQQGHLYLASKTFYHIGSTFVQERVDSAQVYFERAITLSQQTGYKELEYCQVREAYDLLKELQPAPEFLNRYANLILELSKSGFREQEDEGIGYLELSLKEKTIEAQEARNQLRLTLMWAGILAGLGAIGVAIWIYRQYRANRQLVKHLRLTNEELCATNKRLAQNDDFQRQVIAILSHDLRQPFSTIYMLSQQLLEDLEKADLELFLEEMRNSATVSLQVLDGLLQWMKLQTIGAPVKFESVSVLESIQNALRFNDSAIRNKQITVDINFPDLQWVAAQPDMLLFINRNILHNAIKFSPEGGSLQITAKVLPPEPGHPYFSSGSLVIEYKDEGPGLAAQVLERLFQKSALPDEDRPKGKGTGLAMIICSEMISNMHGEIWAENNANGVGATFSYKLPLP